MRNLHIRTSEGGQITQAESWIKKKKQRQVLQNTAQSFLKKKGEEELRGIFLTLWSSEQSLPEWSKYSMQQNPMIMAESRTETNVEEQ